MKQDRFVTRFQAEWDEFEALLGAGRKAKPKADNPKADNPKADNQAVDLPAPEEFPGRYRRIAGHLAIARSRGYSIGLIERLEHLTLRGHQRLYQRREPLGRHCVEFVLRSFPRQVRAAWRSVGLASVLFFGTMMGAALLAVTAPQFVLYLVGPEQIADLEQMYDPSARRLGRDRDAGDDVVMFGFYIRNNTSIGFQTFAGGLVFGLGTVFFLVFNGLYIGAVAGHLTSTGAAVPFWSFVAGHSAFELTAIVLSGAAGLRLGWALLRPGGRTRVRSLVWTARESIGLVYGAALLFFLAAFVEAFWSSLASIPPSVKYSVGGLLWLWLAVYFSLGGRGQSGGA